VSSPTGPAEAPEERPPRLGLALFLAFIALVAIPTLYYGLTVTSEQKLAAEQGWERLFSRGQSHTAAFTWSDLWRFLSRKPGVLAYVLLLAQGILLTLGLGCVWLFSPAARRGAVLTRVAVRPAPAFRLVDLVAVVVLFKFLPVFVMALALLAGGRTWGTEARVLANLIVQFGAYALAIALVVGLARMRGGPDGAAGIWPFWETPGASPRRSRAMDIALGLGALFVCFWLLGVANAVNLQFLRVWHVLPDTNPFLEVLQHELQGPGRLWVYALMFLAAVVVAAVAEEILFRGLLYNVLRRYLDRWTAAVGAALIFSFIHGVVSNLWSLFLLALVLTWLYERTGRLLAPIVLHAANNTIALVLVLMGVTQG